MLEVGGLAIIKVEVDGVCKKQKYAECGWKHPLKLTSPPRTSAVGR